MARAYFKQGFAVVPFRDKKPVGKIKWKCWQNQPQTKAEFEELPWDQANMFGVVCGVPNANGYFCAVDIDTSDFDLKLLPTTQFEKSPRGYHALYYSRKPVRGSKHPEVHADFLGAGNMVFMGPQYESMNDNQPTVVEDAELMFQELLVELGGEPRSRSRQPLTEVLQPQMEGNRNNAIFDFATKQRDSKVDFNTALTLALKINEIYRPPLPDYDVENTVKSAYENPLEKTNQNKQRKENKTFFNNDSQGHTHFQPILFAKHLLNCYNFKTTPDDETIWVYNDKSGIYTPDGEIKVKTEMARHLQENTRSHYLNDILFFIRANTYFDRPKKPANKIAMENGFLNIDTQKLQQFTPEEFVISRIPVNYDPNANCLKIQEFLSQVVGDDVAIIQEAIGYCLLQAMPFHKAFMLVGSGANGKSTLINLIKRFLGAENVTSLTLQEICDDLPAKANLFGKLANLCADLPAKALKNTGIFKTLTGNDPVSARQLYGKYFSFVNTAKFFFSANEIPKTNDDTTAFYRRWTIINCPNVFVGQKRDPTILAKITTSTELSGLLNWALEGLQRLLKQGEFSRSKTIEQQRAEYIKQSNTAMAYIEDNLTLELDPDAFIEQRALYEDYVKWCQKNKFKPTRKAEFTQTLYRTLAGVEQGEHREDGKRVTVYKYIAKKKSGAEGADSAEGTSYKLSAYTASYSTALERKREDNAVKGLKEQVSAESAVPAEEHCEACGVSTELRSIQLKNGDRLRRCQKCVDKLENRGVQFEFVENLMSKPLEVPA